MKNRFKPWLMYVAVSFSAAIPAASFGKGKAGVDQLTVDGNLDVTINGQHLKLEVDPSAPLFLVLNPDAAAKAGLKQGSSFKANIGRTRVIGSIGTAIVDFGGSMGQKKERIAWFVLPFSRSAQGVINPGAIPTGFIRLPGPGGGGKIVASFPTKDRDYLGLGTDVLMGSHGIVVRFSLRESRSLATAATGAELAKWQRGYFDGEQVSRSIAFGISRPVRFLKLSSPFSMGPISLTGVDVRVSDFGSVASIPEDDPNEIIVVASKKGQTPRYDLVLGRDELGKCGLLVNNAAKSISILC